MKRHHNGSGRRRVIPADWSAHHRPVLVTTRTATVELRRPGGTRGDFDPATGTYESTPHPPYFTDEKARIQILPATERESTAGEQEISTMQYAVGLDHVLAGIQLDDLCKVTAVDADADAELVGRELIVTAVERGSLHWERRLLCTDNLETQEA